MLELFRRNLFINSVLLLPYILLIRIYLFVTPSDTLFDGANSFIFNSYTNFDLGPFLQWIITSLLVFFQASMINRLSIKNSYDKHLSHVPGMIYALLVSIFPEYLALSPALIANTFVLLALFSLNKLYKKPILQDIFSMQVYGVVLRSLSIILLYYYFLYSL